MKYSILSVLTVAALLAFQAPVMALQTTSQFDVTLTYTGSTCEVSTKNIDVPMGTYDTKDFISSNATPTVFFNIGFTCDAEVPSVEMIFNGTPDSNDPSLFALTNAGQTGVAGGLGLYLYNADTGFAMVPGKTGGGTVAATGGAQEIHYGARYKKTSGAVTAGTADATVTFTMTYE